MHLAGCLTILFASFYFEIVLGAPNDGNKAEDRVGEAQRSSHSRNHQVLPELIPSTTSTLHITQNTTKENSTTVHLPVVAPRNSIAKADHDLFQTCLKSLQGSAATASPPKSDGKVVTKDVVLANATSKHHISESNLTLHRDSNVKVVTKDVILANAPSRNHLSQSNLTLHRDSDVKVVTKDVVLANATSRNHVSESNLTLHRDPVKTTQVSASSSSYTRNTPYSTSQTALLAGAGSGRPTSQLNQNFQQALISGGLNILGEGAKAGATIPTIPVRVVGAGLDEFRKAAVSRLGSNNAPQPMDIKTKIVSTVLNTVSSQLAQANLGGQMVEEALTNRVKDMASKIAEIVVPNTSQTAQITNSVFRSSGGLGVLPVTTKVVDTLLDQFNTAVRRNDLMLMQALKAVIARVEPQKNST